MHALTTATSGSATREAAFEQALDTLAGNDQDIPFAVGYHLDCQGRPGATGRGGGGAAWRPDGAA